MILTPLRRSLLRPWIWIGGLIAALIFLPNVICEIRHDWATLELLRNVKSTGKNVVLAPIPFVMQQAMMLNPFTAPLWIAGLIWLFTRREYRFLAWTYVILLMLFIRLEAKDYYLAPIYPALFAAGAVVVTKKRVAAIAVGALIVIGCLISAPLALPILPPEKYLAYQRALGVKAQKTEVSHTAEMPQIFADQFGAIDFYGPKYGLPNAISGHQAVSVQSPARTPYFRADPCDVVNCFQLGGSNGRAGSSAMTYSRTYCTVADVASRFPTA